MSEEYDLSRAFERIESYLIDSMMRNFRHHRAEETAEGINWEQWQVKQLEALEEYRRNNREKFSAEFAELNDRVGNMLKATASDASYKQEQKILKAIQKGFKPNRPAGQSSAAFFKLNERKMNALITSTTNDLKRAEQAILRLSNDKYRQAIFDAQVFINSGAGTYEQAVDMAVKNFVGAGLQCVEYSNGARHTLHDYADMALRTANKRAYLRGEGVKMQEWGISTVIINRRHGACGRCADFIGMVFIDDVYAGGKKTDAGGKYPLLSDAMKSGLFHPRCKDSTSLYLEGISTPPEREVLPEKSQEELTEIEQAEQRTQYGRRMEKMYKRLSKYALDPDNKTEYKARSADWNTYAEKWQEYHENLLEKAGESGIIKTDNKNNGFEESDYRQFNTGDEVNEFFYYDGENRGLLAKKNSRYGKWLSSLSKDEESAIQWYAADGYGDINDYLRKRDGWEYISSNVQEATKQIDSAISRFELKDDIVVQRGVEDFYGASIVESGEWDEVQELVGKTFFDKGYGSSTVLSGNNVATAKPFLFEIEIPAGKGCGAYINRLAGQYQDVEYEFLIARDSKFVITDVIKNNESIPEQTIVKMRMIINE